MREIKFRAWDKRNRKMLYNVDPDKIYMGLNGKLYNGLNGENISDDFVLMQYTGLKDMNGKEIYEGDIVKKELTDGFKLWNEVEDPIGKVFYENGCFYVGRKFKIALGGVIKCEVIGNVYENKKLLEAKNERISVWRRAD